MQKITVHLTTSDGKSWYANTNILPFTRAQTYYMGRRTEDGDGNIRQPIVKVELDGSDCSPSVNVVTSQLPPTMAAIVKPGAINPSCIVASMPPPPKKK